RLPSRISGLGLMCARFSRSPVLKSSKTRTRHPLVVRASTKCEPMNPAPPVTKESWLIGLIREEGFHVVFRIKRFQIVQLLTDADEFHRQAKLLFNAEDRTTLGGAVELREDDASAVDGLLEHLCLHNCVLARGRVEHEKHFVGRAFNLFAENP